LLAQFLDSAQLGSTPVLAGVIPLKSAKMAAWLNANVPGVRVPAGILEELAHVGPAGEAAKGIEIAARTIRRLRDICAGAHIMAIGWEMKIPEILHAAQVSQGDLHAV
jgi:methylenetetrahydrofolate reductase (NADPH)